MVTGRRLLPTSPSIVSRSHTAASPIASRPGSPLRGRIRVPGDKSISHRALIFGLLARGETRVENLLEADDVLRTAEAARALGAGVTREAEGRWRVVGAGIGGLREPASVLDFGNAGTGSRLMMGVAGSHPITATFDGDASLRKRPMRRILDPLVRMGATVVSEAPGGRVPLSLRGPRETIPITYETPAPSAQIKSAVLLAGLNSPGITTVVERQATRDHTERMLSHFGATVSVAEEDAGRRIALVGQPDLKGTEVVVPADPSSAAFPLVAALVTPGSEVVVENVMMNPLRTGLITTLVEMGAAIEFMNRRDIGGETVADIRASYGPLKGVEVPPERAPSMIDEYPVLAVAASFAAGPTLMRGLEELRVKESDRLAAVAAGLAANGIAAEISGDDLLVHGTGGKVPGGGLVATHMDHRIAMAFLVMGLASRDPVTADDSAMIATSFPGFAAMMRELGAELS
ncbi:3-phosphoshikimate 1-carboxyvinyltransferase [Enterovirga aerilata]|uniref:3-phosphoshikimate 1-carboxyvinyltransferase n=1 Tax=Enterovirga aerilata TaxID=2730920 RepID=A0A849I4W5_9HYPH|nr:3-phosphoshikimate 1-carboxyvinyltransferase [Enterovirga sp. DB1703]NNM71097.1 3-phosphoshikimate 1-carboxyvinyltransferase [Enterovirga sp. DB1703]